MNTPNRKLFINVAPCFTRIAIVENDRLAEVYIEGKSRRRLLGNVYLGRITNVLAGIQAAFVDIGLKRDAFLYIHDILSPPADHDMTAESTNGDDLREDLAVRDMDISGTVEAIYEVIREKSINELVQPGQRILIQITREPMEMKGARVTAHITIPGRYLVLMASSSHIGISKRIGSDEERNRLKQLLEDIRPPDAGLIVRTAAEGMSRREFENDIAYLNNIWKKIQLDAKSASPPELIYHDLDAILQVMRDLFDDSVESVLIDSEDDFLLCRQFAGDFAPDLIDRIRFYNGATPLFTRYNLEEDLNSAIDRRVELPSGGYLIFDETEAMTVIDVNTGRFAGKRNLEETVLKTNLEAAEIIPHQVRLRDIGGIIVIDFIDMEMQAHRQRVIDHLNQCFSSDRSKVNISGFSEMGLVEITRKRIKRSLSRTFLQNCPHCHGRGKIMHPQTVAAKAIDDMLCAKPPGLASGIRITLHPSAKPYVDMCKESVLQHFSSRGIRVEIFEDETYRADQYTLIWL